jgi:hypothetical protein
MKKILIGAGLAFLAFTLITLMSIDETPQPYVSPNVATKKTPIDIEEVFLDGFMEGCIGGVATYAYCSCSYKELRKDFTISEMMDWANLTEDELLSQLYPYTLLCEDKLGQ